MQSKIGTYRFLVEPFHVDFTGHLFPGVLGNHLLNAAGRHSHDRGWGIDQLNERRYTWVLSRLCMELTDMPAQYEEVEVETWVESVMRLFTERNFLIRRTSDGHVYGYARSVWAMIDVETRQPSNLLALNDGDILRYVVAPEDKPCPIEKFQRPARLAPGARQSVVQTHYSDVDINGHINSIKYIEHILDLFPRECFAEQGLHRLEIAYKAEALMGDELTLACESAGKSNNIEIRKNVGDAARPDGETVVQAKVVWR